MTVQPLHPEHLLQLLQPLAKCEMYSLSLTCNDGGAGGQAGAEGECVNAL